jgi:Tol biopolymer transport system component
MLIVAGRAIVLGAATRRFGTIGASLVLAIGLATALAAGAGTRGAKTTRVSVSSHEGQANRESHYPSISLAGRYVAFWSEAGNLVRGDTNGRSDIFIRDRKAGTTRRVSVSSAGRQANGHNALPRISADGRFIAFYSTASNLVRRDTNGDADVFVHDRRTHRTKRVSVSSSGAQGNDDSFDPVISADGRFVGIYSKASNLVRRDTNGTFDTFVHNLRTGRTERVSVSSDGEQAQGRSGPDSLSANGRFVAFTSVAGGLVPGDTNHNADVFVHDRRTGRTERVSVSSAGEQGEGIDGSSMQGSISADGRFVAFESFAPNLVPDDTNQNWDIFVHDRETGRTRRVSVGSSGVEANRGSYPPAISANGRFVAFSSGATNLVPGDTSRETDVFVHDRRTGRTRRVSLTSRGSQGNGNSAWPAITGAGRFIAFESTSTNLARRDTNRVYDIFVRGPLRWRSR